MKEKDRPVIGIVATRCRQDDPPFGEKWITYINSCYVESVSNNGGAPLMIPFSKRSTDGMRMLEFCDGLIFPGGTDLNPMLYNEEPTRQLGPIDPETDEYLAELMTEVLVLKKPILAICKGMQLMNVLMGGSLYQDLGKRKKNTLSHHQLIDRSYPHHRVDFLEGSIMREIFRQKSIYTNSIHHQSLRFVPKALRITGRTQDGVVEAVEGVYQPLLGVQWHPEDMAADQGSSYMNELFRYFIEVMVGGKEWILKNSYR